MSLGCVARATGLTACLTLLAASTAAGSVLYFQNGRSIDRLNLSGRHRRSQIAGSRATGEGVFGMTIDGEHLYWSEVDGLDRSSIWSARLDGTDARVLVHMPSSGPHGPVIAGGQLYWTETGSIARANLDGSHVQRNFVPLPLQSSGEAADGLATDGHYIYFSRCQEHAIGRVALDGSEANPDFIVLADGLCPQAIAVAAGRIFWSSLGIGGPGLIGRSNLNGSEEDANWLVMPTAPEGGPWSLATSGAYLFFTWGGTPESAPTFIGTVPLEESLPHPDTRMVRASGAATALAIAR